MCACTGRRALNTPTDLRRTFKGLSKDVLNGLEAAGVKEPTPAQLASIPQILTGKDVFIASETGSGKTLAYLAPIFEILRPQKTSKESMAKPCRPRALILVPTIELVTQIGGVAKELSHHVRLRVVPLEGKHLARRLAKGCDIVIGTPGKVNALRRRKELFMSHVERIVVDEADVLLGFSFWKDVEPILATRKREFRSKVDMRPDVEKPAQIVAVAASVGKATYKLLKKNLNGLKMIEAPGFRRPPATISRHFIKCSGPDGKIVELLHQLRKRKWIKCLVFCNAAPACSFVAQTLSDAGITSSIIHGELHPSIRRENYQKFVEGGGVLVATDVGSRGLDFLEVGLVVLYDMPNSLVDYLHRIGRTGRAGKKGVAVTIVSQKDAAKAHTIQTALKRSQGIPGQLSKYAKRQVDDSSNH